MKIALRTVLLLSVSVMLAACAPSDLVIKPSYQPAGESRGAGGPFVLASTLESPNGHGGAERVQFVYGEVKDSDGKVMGSVVSQTSPTSLVRDALEMELLKAGYTVQVAQALPAGVEQGAVLTAATVTLDEVSSLVKIEADCKVNLSLELWKKGALVRRLTYGKNVSDFAVKDREQLHRRLLQKALSAVMKDATADLVKYLK